MSFADVRGRNQCRQGAQPRLDCVALELDIVPMPISTSRKDEYTNGLYIHKYSALTLLSLTVTDQTYQLVQS